MKAIILVRLLIDNPVLCSFRFC